MCILKFQLYCCQIKNIYIYVFIYFLYAFTNVQRFATRNKVTLRLLKLYFYVAKWSRMLNISLSDWCCSVSKV